MTYEIDCRPDGTIDVKQNDGIAPIGLLITLPEPHEGVQVSINATFVRNMYRRMFGEEDS